jgi:hypothetical protein
VHHPLKKRLEILKKLNLGRCIAGNSDVLLLNIVVSKFFTQHELPALLATLFLNDYMEVSMYSQVAPQELLTVTSRNVTSLVFYTNGSLIDGCAGIDIHWTEEGGFGYKNPSPAVIFTGELTALFVTLRYECKQMCSDLLWNRVEVEIMIDYFRR